MCNSVNSAEITVTTVDHRKILAVKFSLVLRFLVILTYLVGNLSLTHPEGEAEMLPLAAWLFDEGATNIGRNASGIVADSTENGHDGEIVGNLKWRKGRFGTALEFGAGDNVSWNYVKVAYHKDLDLNMFTITAWINVSRAVEPLQMIVNRETNRDLRNYALWIRTVDDAEAFPNLDRGKAGDFACGFGITFPGVKGFGIAKTRTVTDGAWHFIGCSYDGVTMVTYIDGQEVGKEENKPDQGLRGKPNKPKDSPLIIGARSLHGAPPERPFERAVEGVNGLIDEVAVWNAGLNALEIKSVMELGLAEKYEGIRAATPRGKLATTWAKLKAD